MAYVHYNAFNALSGFLYIKVEGKDEQYNDIEPKFDPKKRLKVGTFKVVSTGYRLGERFLQIIFDNAIIQDVDEVYVTMYDNTDELKNLKEIFINWGFEYYGLKSGKELVLVKRMKEYDRDKSIKENFPNIDYSNRKVFLPIKPEYHTKIFPDSVLFTERKIKFDNYWGYRYALEKIYIAFSDKYEFKKGDIALIYRMGESWKYSKYASTVTSICVIEDVVKHISNINVFLKLCQNRSVFNNNELVNFWNKYNYKLQVIKLIYIIPFKNKVILDRLRQLGIVAEGVGPRSGDVLSEFSFDSIIKESQTELYGYK